MSGGHRSYDVIVIGAGSVGVPAAYFLAKSGLEVLVIDRYASVGQGANKAAIGGVRATHSDTAKIRLGLKSIEILSNWQDRHGDNIEWHTGGYTFVAYGDREEQTLKSLLAVQQSHGLNIDWLDREPLLEAVPALEPRGLLGGTLSPEDGNASPLLALHAFYAHARRHGATFRFGETVTGIAVENGRVGGVQTDRDRYSAPVVINAAGAHARHIAALAEIDVPVTPDAHEGGVTEPVARFLEPMVVDIRPRKGSANFYFYQHHTGQVVFCITPSPPIVGTDRRETSSFLPMVARRMIEVMPRLMNLKVRRTWRGLYPMTPDGAPVVGWVREVEGFVQAAGMCGQGFMLGPGLGSYLARLVQDELSAEDREVFDLLSPYRAFESAEQLR
ncbi:MAG: FAD-binding oxidoreductase [Xanthomonadales bacterium]|nr:FAD-binding oxidoreductase [Gammaproteobacteria bacterium]MBT8050904.1 FAD-binding oxidoreductase [Gammaproteobacteria bacterium]MBT8057460.1 FAD-binding oxidoreductase [Gammaproteobacteria bacterium]NNJ78686.1 FAD-binding oxidoreductase [Xanthomonadales bacterium]NNL05700.1 FAD-binding oxidoreductase [Xanthomonadales bacterium]